MKNYFFTFSNFLKNNGIIKNRNLFSNTCKSIKELKSLKQILGELMINSNSNGKNKTY
jgi:hypothetical protein